MVELDVVPFLQAGAGERVDQRPRAGQCALDALGADDRRGGGHHGVRRIAGLARGIHGDQDRVADQVDLGRHGDVEHRAVVRAGRLVYQRQREVGLQRLQREFEHRVSVHRRDLRLRVHLRSARAVLHVLARDHGADLRGEPGELTGIGLRCGHRLQRQ